ncbi:biosynthetic arginine decarboxylase [Sulfuriroseicoccus oceanibius]|uniref:Biosynthetic arginine decarboxylase n=1 Tax=Sulfuriroseicoccus oceanibius TaxID=2707525 RepID=A0A6B3L8X3_9BACT|nr:biosynthetic arginine decarboxylase [Sulfuriroseicoccus oceanibius]QQL43671.1 biosynthetic arginine decarboxylase [Sulfuriroseicoccus oceanibius]
MSTPDTSHLESVPASAWSADDSAALYGITDWGNNFFSVSDAGEVTVRLRDGKKRSEVPIASIIDGLRDRGTDFPVLLRFRDLLHDRISELNQSFRTAIADSNYQGDYRGVYPIKVNQQRQVIEEITAFGKRFHYGLEAGSKPELIAALAHMHDEEAYLICNGYKDEEFIDLALTARKMGLQVIIVLEMPSELNLVIERAEKLGIRPLLGVRARLATKSEGKWQESAGDKSVFGLSASQIIETVDQLKESGYIDCLTLLHYHQGSQIPNIRAIREAATEATRMYIDLVKEGAPMGILDTGGGLAVDYDGSHTDFPASCNYTISEYCADLVEVIGQTCTAENIEHPTIISESGRAVVAYYSVLVFNILDVTKFQLDDTPPTPPATMSPTLKNLIDVAENISTDSLQENFNDATYYRDQIREMHVHGRVSLRERGYAEHLFWNIVTKITRRLSELEFVPEELAELRSQTHDYYYGNFSLFQSLPDSWAIDQLFPIMPIHRLAEKPTQQAVLADITCDCDGKIDRFVDRRDVAHTLPLHPIQPDDTGYCIGVFLVGAYQETLGDLHNLLGDTNVVGVHLENGKPVYSHEVEGDTVADVLSYVEYEPKVLVEKFRSFAENAVNSGKITPRERKEVMKSYRHGLDGYTYFESDI